MPTLGLPLPDAGAATNLKTRSLNLKDFILRYFRKAFEAMPTNNILQILVFSLFFGFAIAALQGAAGDDARRLDRRAGARHAQAHRFRHALAPFGVFAAVAAVITTQGLGVLVTYGKFIGGFYLGLAVLWVVLIGAAACSCRERIRAAGTVREPIMIAFSTASSEAAYPKTMEQLEKFGVKDRITGFVLPLGYSFNLDGSMMYQAFAALFIAQAYGIDLSLGTADHLLLC